MIEGAFDPNAKTLGPERAQRRVDVSTPQDAWMNRNAGMQCRTCIWYVPKARTGTADAYINPLKMVGRCRRHCPTMNGFPVVYPVDWCGDHRVDENKI